MKIRKNLVSNSSSSSFIISGKEIQFDDVPKFSNCILITEKEVFGEGCDKIVLTPEIYNFLKENRENLYLNINECRIFADAELKYHNEEYCYVPPGYGNDPGYSPENEDGIFVDISYHATGDSLEELKDHYLKGDES